MAATEALLAVVVQRADGVVAAVARREVDGYHEVEVQSAFDELQEARLGDALRVADVDGASVKAKNSTNPCEAPPWSASCRPGLLQKSVVLVWRREGEEELRERSLGGRACRSWRIGRRR